MWLNRHEHRWWPTSTWPGPSGWAVHNIRSVLPTLAISAGANVKVVQRMLGHKSAAMTLDTYADLFDDDLTGLADKLDVSSSGTRLTD